MQHVPATLFLATVIRAATAHAPDLQGFHFQAGGLQLAQYVEVVAAHVSNFQPY